MHKIIVFATFLLSLFLTTTSSAMDLKGYGWNKANFNTQTPPVSYFAIRIKKLEAENEQLRNSVSIMRAGRNYYGKETANPRIQGLIDENKRLIAEINVRRGLQETPAKKYLKKINILREENHKLKQWIDNLEAENKKLKLLKNMEKASYKYKSDEDIAKKEKEITALKKDLTGAKEENRKVSLALMQATQKVFDYSNDADKIVEAYETNLKTVETLKERLLKAQKENLELKTELETASKNLMQANANNGSTQKFEALRVQNESLRETIKAQGESLRSVGETSKTLKRLVAENTTLQQRLALAQNANNMGSKISHEMTVHIKKLEKEIAQRDTYIKKTLTEKSKEIAELSINKKQKTTGQILSLQEKNAFLLKALDNEKQNNAAYLGKISKYQEGMKKIKDMEKEKQQSEDTIAALKLENQELEARLRLVDAKRAKTEGLSMDEIEPAYGNAEQVSAENREKEKKTLFKNNNVSKNMKEAANKASDDGIEKLLGNRHTESLLATKLVPLPKSVAN